MITKDSFLLIHPEIIMSQIKNVLGSDSEIFYLCDLNTDSIPTPIIGAKAFLIQNKKQLLFAKVGNYDKLTKEYETQKMVLKKNNGETNPGIRLLNPLDVVKINKDLALLILPFCGLHTLEVCRHNNDVMGIIKGIQKISVFFLANDIVWPNLMARNIVRDYYTHQLCPVDWETGFWGRDKISENCNAYKRCIELIEEEATFAENFLPYWTTKWPKPLELVISKSNNPIFSRIAIQDISDPRIRALINKLGITENLSDSQFLRIIMLLCSMCECKAVIYSSLYGADQISEWSGQDFRIICTLLSWYLKVEANDFRTLSRFQNDIAMTGNCIYKIWRAGLDSEIESEVINNVIRKLNQKISSLAKQFLKTYAWKELLAEKAYDFIIDGNFTGEINREFEILNLIPN